MSERPDLNADLDRVMRRSYGKLLALLVAYSGDLDASEDALSAALLRALDVWARGGAPDNPEGWLLVTARRRLLDDKRRASRHRSLLRKMGTPSDADASESEVQIPDERLRLLFLCAHPSVDANARAPLLLRHALGLESDRIAGRFLCSPDAMRQRLSRATRSIRDAGVRFEVPGFDELAERVGCVLDAVYGAFGAAHDELHLEGAVIETGATDALELARACAELMPDEAEAHGLRSLIAACLSRRAAQRDERGVFIPLDGQDTGRWDRALLDEAEASLRRASLTPGAGPYRVEAAIQSAHAYRRLSGSDNWADIVDLYDLLVRLRPSVGALVGRAAAIGEHLGPDAAIRALDEIPVARVTRYQPYFAVRAHALQRLGDRDASARALRSAIGLTADAGVRAYLLDAVRA
ncbi:MAG: DUF6596 domain-containing protein [Planctomycetota bacterium]